MAKVQVGRPAAGEYSPMHASYVAAVPDGDVLKLLEKQGRETQKLLAKVDEKRSHHRYAPGKWSIREVIGHIIDGERVFTYRALRVARADATPMPGFDENAWAAASNAETRTLKSLAAELAALRAATVAMFRGFGEAEFTRRGMASGTTVSTRGLLYVVAGHERHHLDVLRERYGLAKPSHRSR